MLGIVEIDMIQFQWHLFIYVNHTDVTADEFDLLCHYLNLPTCFVTLLTESNLLGNLVER